ncbi:MAG: M28 family peptidase [Bacteroidales bacterium]|nr:M28 family peptidase [Bacteroidales bacterium]
MRKLTKIIFFLLLCLNAHAGDSWTKEREKAKSLITQEKLAREVSFLTDSICQGRASGTRGSVEAAMWIRRKFKEAGLIGMTDSWTQGFNIRHGLNGRNVIGMLPGSKSIPCDRYIIVGAHYDHLGMLEGKMYPGADSNASGVTAMTSLAEMFGAMRKMGKIYSSNIIFVAFDAKEFDLKGSEALWNMIEYGRLRNPLSGETITRDKISLMVNIDQIGSSLAPINKDRKDYMIMLGTSSLKRDRRDLLHRCNIEEGIGMDIALDYYGSENFTKIFYRLSDQKVFVDNRMPAVLFTSGITMNNNKTWDRTENLDLEIYQKRISLMYHWIEKML